MVFHKVISLLKNEILQAQKGLAALYKCISSFKLGSADTYDQSRDMQSHVLQELTFLHDYAKKNPLFSLKLGMNIAATALRYLRHGSAGATAQKGLLGATGYLRGVLSQEFFRRSLKYLGLENLQGKYGIHPVRPDVLKGLRKVQPLNIEWEEINIGKRDYEKTQKKERLKSLASSIKKDNSEPIYLNLNIANHDIHDCPKEDLEKIHLFIEKLKEFFEHTEKPNIFLLHQIKINNQDFSFVRDMGGKAGKQKALVQAFLSSHGAIQLNNIDQWVLDSSIKQSERDPQPIPADNQVLAAKYWKEVADSEFIKSGKVFSKELTEAIKEQPQPQTNTEFMRAAALKMLSGLGKVIQENYETLSITQKVFISERLKKIENLMARKNGMLDALASSTEIKDKYVFLVEEVLFVLNILDITSLSLRDLLNKKAITEQYPGQADETARNAKVKQYGYLAGSGLHAISEVFKLVKKDNTEGKVYHTPNIYFEIHRVLDDIFGMEKYGSMEFSPGIQSIRPSDEPVSAVFCDFHPNNANALKIDSLDKDSLLSWMSANMNKYSDDKPFTLILDTSTQHLYDAEVKEFLENENIKSWVKSGKLRIVVIQSLQKFASINTDKFPSSAILLIAGKKDDPFIEGLKKAEQDSVPEIADQFLGFLFREMPGFPEELRNRSVANSRELYDLLKKKNTSVVAENKDPGSSYISLQFNEELKHLLKGKKEYETLPLHIIEFLHKGVIQYLRNSAEEEGYILTTRTGFGFFESSVSDCRNSIRFIFGSMEDEKSLKHYSERITFVEKLLKNKGKLSTKVSGIARQKGLNLDELKHRENYGFLTEINGNSKLSKEQKLILKVWYLRESPNLK